MSPFPELDSEFFFRFLMSREGQSRILDNFQGSAQGGINLSFAPNTEVPVAPLSEQKRIVEELQKLLPRVDSCRERLDRIPAILKRFRQSVLAAACSGRLTEDWREAENIPDSEMLPFGDLDIQIQTGPFGSALHKSDYVKNGIPLVNPMHIKNGEILPDDNFAVSRNKAKELQRYRLKKNDIVLGRRGEMGRAAPVREEHAGLLCGTGSMFIRPNKESYDAEFISIFLRSQHAVMHFEESSVGSTMTNLNQGIVKSLMFPDIELSEQKEIVRRVNALFQMADAVQKRYEAGKAAVDKLTQSILAKAFRGELVPQNPDDEPAEELLARIREKKATAEKPARRRRRPRK